MLRLVFDVFLAIIGRHGHLDLKYNQHLDDNELFIFFSFTVDDKVLLYELVFVSIQSVARGFSFHVMCLLPLLSVRLNRDQCVDHQQLK